jgi:hypothetical protein
MCDASKGAVEGTVAALAHLCRRPGFPLRRLCKVHLDWRALKFDCVSNSSRARHRKIEQRIVNVFGRRHAALSGLSVQRVVFLLETFDGG